MTNLEKFINQNLQWESIVKIPSVYFVENSIIGKIVRKISTIGNHRTHKGHGLHISCKIVLPTFCQANCSFCFNKVTRETQKHEWLAFTHNLCTSLSHIFTNINKRKISFDITGNEPTFDVEKLLEVLETLTTYKSMFPQNFEKIVITTNGFHLNDLLKKRIEGIVDYINISLHSTDYEERCDIFKTDKIPNNLQIQFLNLDANQKGIETTSVAVISEPIKNFENFIERFSTDSKQLGFKNSRIRVDYKGDKETRNQFFDNFKNEPIDLCPGLMTKNIVYDEEYHTDIYLGVKDLTEFVIGSEIIIDDDGYCYLDYGKKYLLTDDIISDVLNKIYWNPKIWWDESKLNINEED